MKNRRGEIATILMLGAVVVMGVTAVISSFTQSNKQSTSSRASSCAGGYCRKTANGCGTGLYDTGMTTCGSGYLCCKPGSAATATPKPSTVSPTSATGCKPEWDDCTATSQCCAGKNLVCKKDVEGLKTCQKNTTAPTTVPTIAPTSGSTSSCAGGYCRKTANGCGTGLYDTGMTTCGPNYLCCKPGSAAEPTAAAQPTQPPTGGGGGGNGYDPAGCAAKGYANPEQVYNCCNRLDTFTGCYESPCSGASANQFKACPDVSDGGGGAGTGDGTVAPTGDPGDKGDACCIAYRPDMYGCTGGSNKIVYYTHSLSMNDMPSCEKYNKDTSTMLYFTCQDGAYTEGQCASVWGGGMSIDDKNNAIDNLYPTAVPEDSGGNVETGCQSAPNGSECRYIDQNDPDNTYTFSNGQCCPNDAQSPVDEQKPCDGPTTYTCEDKKTPYSYYKSTKSGCKINCYGTTAESCSATYNTVKDSQCKGDVVVPLSEVPADEDPKGDDVAADNSTPSMSEKDRIKSYCRTNNTAAIYCNSPNHDEYIGSVKYCCDFDPKSDTEFAKFSGTHPAPATFSTPPTQSDNDGRDLTDYLCTAPLVDGCKTTILQDGGCWWGRSFVGCKKGAVHQNYCCPTDEQIDKQNEVQIQAYNVCTDTIKLAAGGKSTTAQVGEDAIITLDMRTITDKSVSILVTNESTKNIKSLGKQDVSSGYLFIDLNNGGCPQ